MIGFIGVIVGVIATGLIAFLREKRLEQQRLRTARRMLRLELEEAAQFIAGSIDKQEWIAEPPRVLSNEQWAEHRNVWGAHADDDAWERISNAFLYVAQVRRNNLDADRGTHLPPGEQRTEDAESVLEPISEALKELGGLEAPPNPPNA